MVKITGGDENYEDARGSGRLERGWNTIGPMWDKNEHDLTDKDINKALADGKNPAQVFGGVLKKMSPPDRKKAKRRIKALEKKRKQ